MMRGVIVALVLALPGVAGAETAQQFDLVCMFGATEVRYRVDLDRGEACEDQCARIWKMGAITSGELTLMDTRPNFPVEIPQTIIVNRTTGELSHWIGGGRPLIERANCKPNAFSGFPRAAF